MIDLIALLISIANSAGIAYILLYRPGPCGADGQDGAAGENGRDGHDGHDGINGRDGVNGQDGHPGKDGQDGRDGKNGHDGMPGPQGETRYQMGGTPATKCSQCGRLLVHSTLNPDGTVQCVDAAGCKKARESRSKQ